MKTYLQISQIFVSLILIFLILLQQRGGGSTLIFGQTFYGTRRGLEKKIFYLTIFFAILFVILITLNFIL